MKSALLTGVLCAGVSTLAQLPAAQAAAGGSPNATPIQHVIIIMQENRSFDSYFGTYPGANGIPKNACIPLDPTKATSHCVKPFHDPHDANAGGPHGAKDAQFDLDDGITKAAMDGFLYSRKARSSRAACRHSTHS